MVDKEHKYWVTDTNCLLHEWVGTKKGSSWKWRYVTYSPLTGLVIYDACIGPDGPEVPDIFRSEPKTSFSLDYLVEGDIKAGYGQSGDLILCIKNHKFRDGFRYKGMQSQRLVEFMRMLRKVAQGDSLKFSVPYSDLEREDDARIARRLAVEEAAQEERLMRKVALEGLSREQLRRVLFKMEKESVVAEGTASVFHEHAITGADAFEMSEADLIEMEIRPSVKRLKILKVFAGFKENGVKAELFEA